MFSTYSDFVPIVILLTLVLSLAIGRNITLEGLKGIDGIFAALGFLFGLVMTFMNLIYISKELFLLSPVIAISCILYLRYRNEFKENPYFSLLRFSNRNNMILSIVWWSLFGVALVTYYFSEIYTRHMLFFFLISGAVAVLGVQIFTSRVSSMIITSIVIVKIFLLSVMLRYSAYFVSPYPIGSDPWAHQEYITYFLEFGRVAVPPDFLFYYVNYPIAHLHAACTALLGSISPHNAMFLLGVILTLSTIIIFLIVRTLTGNVQLALISVLLLNFTDALIRWGIQVLAMSFGIAIYAFIVFFALKIYLKPEDKVKYIFFMLMFLCIIVWTHTVSAFVTLVSLFALLVGYMLYDILYNQNTSSLQSQKAQLLIALLTFLVVITVYHWMDPSYPFFQGNFEGLYESLSLEAKFLGATTVSNIHNRWEELLQPIGFCLCAFFGIIGTLYCLSRNELAEKCFPLAVLALILFSVCYAFPIFGMQNIVPGRWPAFAFISFSLFVGLGLFCSLSLLRTKRSILCAVAIIFFIGSFFMITNGTTNHDSPLIGEDAFLKLIWTESEMSMYRHLNETYDGIIIADEHTHQRPFKTFLKNKRSTAYRVLPSGEMDVNLLSTGLVIWKRDSLTRPVDVRDNRYISTQFLGDKFWKYLNNNYSCISDTYSARSYLP